MADSSVDPDRGKPDMKWIVFAIMLSLTSAVILPDCLNFLEATSDVRQGPDATSPAWGAERSPVPQSTLTGRFRA
jgi:hypothetical protein